MPTPYQRGYDACMLCIPRTESPYKFEEYKWVTHTSYIRPNHEEWLKGWDAASKAVEGGR